MDLLSNMCRACMRESTDCNSIFDKKLINNELLLISEMIMLCTSVKIDTSDNKPSNICYSCSVKVSEAYNFRQQVIESNSMFLACLENIKSNDDDDEYIETESPGNLFDIEESNPFLNSIQDVDIIVENMSDPEPEYETVTYTILPPSTPEREIHNQLDFIDDSAFEPNDNYYSIDEVQVIRMGVEKLTCNEFLDDGKVEILSCDEEMLQSKLRQKREKRKVYNERQNLNSNVKDRLCNICGQSFDNSNKFRAHYKKHFPEKCHQCRYCDKYFVHKFMWVEHERTHTLERPFKCELCNYSAKQKTSLQIHMRTHTGERPYKCPHCDHRSLTSSQRLQHIERTHTVDRKKYICDECGKEYTGKSRLKEHKLRHTDAPRPEFPCDYCDKVFAYRKNCLAHARKHHQ